MLAGRLIGGAARDPFIGDVTFLNDFEGQSGESFTPQIGPAFEWWNNTLGTQPTQYDGEITAAQSKFGTRSCYFKEVSGAPGAGWQTTSSLTGTASQKFSLQGDMTIECHVYLLNNTSDVFLISAWDFGTYQFSFYIGLDGKLNYRVSQDGTTTQAILTQETIPVGGTFQLSQWYHVAICRENNDFHMFVDGNYTDGANNGQRTVASTMNIAGTLPGLCIGQPGADDGGGNVEAYVTNIRITDGTARYTSAFTPPTAVFPAV